MNEDLLQNKARLREQLKQRRSALAEPERQQHAQRITEKILARPEVEAAGAVFIYVSSGSEAGTRTLIDVLLESGKQVAVPKILDRETMIAVAFRHWDELTPAALGIPAPKSGTALEIEFDITITPGLGFTPAGQRIGFGAGYYDRWFEKHVSGVRIAPAFEVQIVDELPVDAHDRPVHRIITEQRDIVVPDAD
ncbi:MAG: 5-formyltetrahydrofolate cyclo-ligase [Thiotrichales bacterium]|nr:5-formyltetrahydrofolate cyclo-ligase [Thiotrichales bacterium]